MTRSSGTTRCGFAILGLLCVTGCSSPARGVDPWREDLSAHRQQRALEAAERFEGKRTDIQLAAARSRWRQGDRKGCVESLREILVRKPDHAGALAMMADVRKHLPSPRKPPQAIAQPRKLPPLAEVPVANERDIQKTLFAAPPIATTISTPTDSEVRAVDFVDTSESHKNSLRPTEFAVKSASYTSSASPAASYLLDRASVALQNGRPSTAQPLLEKVVHDNQADESTVLTAAVLPLRSNHPDLALKIATSASRQFPQSAGLFRVIGTAHYRGGDFQSSQVALQKALFLDSAHPLTYLLMGFTLSKMGDSEAANWHFQQAQTLDTRPTTQR